MFTAYGIDLVDRIWFVYIVMSLIVAYLFGCVLTAFVAVTLYIPSCVDHLPKWHMMCADVSFTGLLCIIVSSEHREERGRVLGREGGREGGRERVRENVNIYTYIKKIER